MGFDRSGASGAPDATGTPKRIREIRLVGTDCDWSLGAGPVVEGPLLSLVMVMAGRSAFLGDLAGNGAAVLGTCLRPESI